MSLSQPVSISWGDLSYVLPAASTPCPCRDKLSKEPQRVLDGVSGHVAGGSLFAVLGPSGSGKTSLLDVLAGRKGSGASGRVVFNGQALSAADWRQTVAYCMQDDALLPLLTVRETLLYALALQGGAKSRSSSGSGGGDARADGLTAPVLAAGSAEQTASTEGSADACVDRVLDVLHLTKQQVRACVACVRVRVRARVCARVTEYVCVCVCVCARAACLRRCVRTRAASARRQSAHPWHLWWRAAATCDWC